MTKKLSVSEKVSRRPASRACVFCHSKHLQCSDERPCKNCIKRDLGHECRDIVRKRAKYLKRDSVSHGLPLESQSQSVISSSMEPESRSSSQVNLHHHAHMEYVPAPAKVENFPLENKMLNTTSDVLNRISTGANHQLMDLSKLEEEATEETKIGLFNSNYLNQEYLMLGDILLHSKPTSPSPSSGSEVQYDYQQLQSVPLLQTAIIQQLQNPKSKRIDTRPFISLGFSKEHQQELEDENNYYQSVPNNNNTEGILDNTADSKFTVNNQIMQKTANPGRAANPKSNPTGMVLKSRPYEYMSPMETHNLYRRVQDIYAKNIVDFEYPHSYHSLTFFLKKRFLGNTLSPEAKQKKRANLLIILKLIASYRPTFISAHKSLLKPYDFQFLEMSFQRSLIDCEKLAQLNLSPTIIWRRTGEIVSLSDDLLSLLGFTVKDILSKRTFIMELMYDDELIVNYFRLFSSVAVGNLHLSIITKCKLIKKEYDDETNSNIDSNHYIEFCSVWTVKRDLFDIPMLIVGQFLPIFSQNEGVRMY